MERPGAEVELVASVIVVAPQPDCTLPILISTVTINRKRDRGALILFGFRESELSAIGCINGHRMRLAFPDCIMGGVLYQGGLAHALTTAECDCRRHPTGSIEPL